MPSQTDNLISWLKAQLRKPYELGATGPDKWDCSSLVQQGFKTNCSIDLPRVSTDQYKEGKEINKTKLQAGDLIFFDTGWSNRKPNHLGVYIGNNKMINANSYYSSVVEEDITSNYWVDTYYGCRRIIGNTQNEMNFSDLNKTHPYYEHIKALYEKNIISGYPDNTFKPENSINRVELLKIVLLAFNIDTNSPGTNPFPDVNSSHWYYPYVVTAYNKNIIKGYPDGKFKPANNINRVEALKIILKTAKTNLTTSTEINFSDIDKNAWYFKYINYAIQKQLIKPTSPTTAEPEKEIQRQEVCKAINLLISI